MAEITKKDIVAALRGIDDDTPIRLIDPTSNWQSPQMLEINRNTPLIPVVVPSSANPKKGTRVLALVPQSENLQLG
jgi:hypothetical protein